MAWEWSHAPEAYAYAETQLRALDKDTLASIYAEWRAHAAASDADNPHGSHDGFCEETYERILREAATMTDEALADDIWTRADEQRTCTNGGWKAWLCPYGCGCHMVAFSDDD